MVAPNLTSPLVLTLFSTKPITYNKWKNAGLITLYPEEIILVVKL